MLKAKERNWAKTFTLELYACEFCELCVQVCPTDAIIMMKSFDLATGDRREMLLDKDRLHAIGLDFAPSWATGNKLRDMQAPPKPVKGEARAHGAGAAPAEEKAKETAE
jgi:formate hydrogenlyase subunit 6/NADH:ubiquinone oxidoreductase subunit I